MNWKQILRRMERLVLESEALEYLREDLPPGTTTLLRAGATEAEIVAMETRLGKRLPPSYREFLKTSNGFAMTPGLGSLCSTLEANWFREMQPDWCEILLEHKPFWDSVERPIHYPNDHWPASYVESMLQVSTGIDVDTVVLNPTVVSSDGEWEAYSLYSHGSTCHRSFADLIAERVEFEDEFIRQNPKDPYAEIRPLLALTRRAMNGQTFEVKAEILKQGVKAALPLAEIAAFEWDWRACRNYVERLLVAEPASAADLRMPMLWIRCAHELGDWNGARDILQRIPPPTSAQAEIYHNRVARVRKMLEELKWWSLEAVMQRSPNAPVAQRQADFEAYCAKAKREYPRNWKTPEDADAMRFSFARSYRLPDVAMEIARRSDRSLRLVDDRFEIARAFAEEGRFDDSWDAVLFGLRHWPNGSCGWDLARVAPASELLTEPVFTQVMTRERCRQVLQTPRGGAA